MQDRISNESVCVVVLSPDTLTTGLTHPVGSGQLVSVLLVLVVSLVAGGQRWSVNTRVVESTVTLISAASLHHEVTTHRPL